MSKRDTRPIEVGDRFETRDARDGGKVVEVVKVEGLSREGLNRLGRVVSAARDRWVREHYTTYRIRTEVHPNNPGAVGRTVRVQENTLRDKYKRVSR